MDTAMEGWRRMHREEGRQVPSRPLAECAGQGGGCLGQGSQHCLPHPGGSPAGSRRSSGGCVLKATLEQVDSGPKLRGMTGTSMKWQLASRAGGLWARKPKREGRADEEAGDRDGEPPAAAWGAGPAASKEGLFHPPPGDPTGQKETRVFLREKKGGGVSEAGWKVAQGARGGAAGLPRRKQGAVPAV